MKTKTPTKKAKTTRKKRTATQQAIDEVVESELSDRQKHFCLLVTTDSQCFGNKSKSYIVAYDIKTKKQKEYARFTAARLYANPNIQKYISKLLKARFNDEAVDNELSKLVSQDKDLQAKRAAISEFNKLKNRVKEPQQVTGPIIIQIAPEVAQKNALPT